MVRSSIFDRFSTSAARSAGHPVAFAAAVGPMIVWLVSDPLFGFGDTWQFVINTARTIVTFLMVFVIQNSEASTHEVNLPP
jgi:low affinity Fe/Cu permease